MVRNRPVHRGDELLYCFAGEFLSRLGCGNRADRFGDNVEVVSQHIVDSDPTHTAQSRIDLSAFHGVARRFNGHRDHVFVQPGHSFLFDGESAFAFCPNACNFLGGQTEARHIRAIANNADRLGGFK
jgi:hypothetical protein